MLERAMNFEPRFLRVLFALTLAVLLPIAAYAEPIGDNYDVGSSASEITDEEILSAIEGADVAVSKSRQSVDSPLDTVHSYSGGNRYETNALQALSGWEESEYAILTTGENWADALAASGLAGSLDCPILLTESDSLPVVTASAISSLGVKKIIILGGQTAVSADIEKAIEELGVVIEERLEGSSRYDTQVAIFNYGLNMGYWTPGEVIVACGADGCFADALSISPVAYARKMPIFITDSSGYLNNMQKQALINGAKDGLFTSSIILGGESRVAAETEGFMWAVSQISSGSSKASTRFAGKNRYETSALIADWAIDMGYLEADGAAFASGSSPYDALGGGALQGKRTSVMLLVDDGKCSQALSVLPKRSALDDVCFFGGTSAVSQASRDYIVEVLELRILDIFMHEYGITLEYAASVEEASSSHDYDSIFDNMNPSTWPAGDAGFYQFAVLSDGYSGSVTAEELNSYIDQAVVYQEANYGVTSNLRGTGEYFIEAAKQYDVNEVYLLAHAAIESAWGCSALAQGYNYDGAIEINGQTYPAGVYYNFYGIGAYDDSPLSGGRSMSIQNGWDSAEDAIMGAASWISNGYINSTSSVSGQQNTLYKMRWDIERIESQGSCWHQYATSLTWAWGISATMSSIYSNLGIDICDTELRFNVPSYKNEQSN